MLSIRVISCPFKVRCFLSCIAVLSLTCQSAEAEVLNLKWDESPDVTVQGYIIYGSDLLGRRTIRIDAGESTEVSIDSLVEGKTYVFCVTAYYGEGDESAPSNQKTF